MKMRVMVEDGGERGRGQEGERGKPRLCERCELEAAEKRGVYDGMGRREAEEEEGRG